MQNQDFNDIVNRIMTGDKALSYSSLRQFLESPKHFKNYIMNPEQTEAMIQGQRFHEACLEPDKFKAKYWVLDDIEKVKEIGGGNPRVTKKYKEWKQEQIDLNEGREMLKIDEYNMYLSMSNYLRVNKATSKFMNNLTDTEASIEFEHDGFKVKGKVDGHGKNEEKFIIDLKKVADARYKKVKWNIEDDNLHLQAGLYCHHLRIMNYYLICIDSKCNTTVIKIDQSVIEKGFQRFEYAIERFQECAEQDLWNSSYEFYNNGYIIYS